MYIRIWKNDDIYLKKSELILRAFGLADGIPPNSLFTHLSLKKKQKGQFQVFLWKQSLFFIQNLLYPSSSCCA